MKPLFVPTFVAFLLGLAGRIAAFVVIPSCPRPFSGLDRYQCYAVSSVEPATNHSASPHPSQSSDSELIAATEPFTTIPANSSSTLLSKITTTLPENWTLGSSQDEPSQSSVQGPPTATSNHTFDILRIGRRVRSWKLRRKRRKLNQMRREQHQREQEEESALQRNRTINLQKEIKLQRQPTSTPLLPPTAEELRFARLRAILERLLRHRPGMKRQEPPPEVLITTEAPNDNPRGSLWNSTKSFWGAVHSVLMSPWNMMGDTMEHGGEPSPQPPPTHQEIMDGLLQQARSYLVGDAAVRRVLGMPLQVVGSKSFVESARMIQVHGRKSTPIEIGFKVSGRRSGVAIAMATNEEGIVKLTLHMEDEIPGNNRDDAIEDTQTKAALVRAGRRPQPVIPVSLSPKQQPYYHVP